MDNQLLTGELEKIKSMEQNRYPLNLPLDFIALVKLSLKELDIYYEEKTENNRKNIFVYYQKELISKFFKGKYPNNTFLGRRISNDKMMTDYYLKLSNIPTPSSKVFTADELAEARNYIKIFDSDFVVKAINLLGGAGVYTDVNQSNFHKYWKKCLEVQKKYYPKLTPKILIQQQVNGLDIRINVAEGIVQSAILRLPGYVIGDGVSSIKQLIEYKNNERSRNPYLYKNKLKLTDELISSIKDQGFSMSDILNEGEGFLLTKQPALRFGGEVINVTKIIDPEILNLGLSSVRAIPGLHTGGVDLLIHGLDSKDGYVIEVNKNPAFQMCIYTDRGVPHNPITEIYKSHILDHKILKDEIKTKSSLNDDEFKLLVERYKYLYEKDKVNSNIIKNYHNEKFEKK